MDATFAALREFGLGNVIVLLGLMGGATFIWRGVWPFFTKEMWPEIKLGWQFKRTSIQAQNEKMSALYDVLIQINSDNVKADAMHIAELHALKVSHEQSIRILEEQSNARHDSVLQIFERLGEKLDRYTDVTSNLVEQWQRINVPPFIETPGYVGPERRQAVDVSEEHQ